jgi:hypothetical protein
VESNQKRSHFDSCLQSVRDVFGRFLYHDAAMGFEGFRTARCGLLDCNTYGRSKPKLMLLVNVISWLLACGVRGCVWRCEGFVMCGCFW